MMRFFKSRPSDPITRSLGIILKTRNLSQNVSLAKADKTSKTGFDWYLLDSVHHIDREQA